MNDDSVVSRALNKLHRVTLGTHTLRKTWGYQARKKGITIEQISEKLGHRSSIVTKRYIGINQDEINKIEDEVCL